MKKMMNITLLAAYALTLLAGAGCSEEKRTLPNGGGDGVFVRYASGIGVQSTILKQTVDIAVLLPDDYLTQSDKRYGVVYLLHGYGDTHTAWNDQWLRIERIVEQCEAEGLEKFIYVMPAGFNSYYVNRQNGNFDYMDFFTRELVPYVDKTYRTVADRNHRAVIGYSMGGFGAMILPSKHPELFSVSVPLSMSFRTDEQYMSEPASGWDSQWGAIFGGKGAAGEARLTEYYKSHCPFYLFTEATKERYAEVAYYFDCGDDEEQLLVANDDLHRQLRDIGMPHEFRVRNGAHTSEYWRSAMPEALRFVECRFEGRAFLPEAEDAAERHTASRQACELAGVPAEVFTPEGYDPEGSYPAVYLFHDGRMPFTADDAMDVLASVQQAKPFVLVAADLTGAQAAPETIVAAAQTAYALKTEAPYRLALAYGNSGEKAYRATLGQPLFDALFLLDAALGTSPGAPNADVFYFLSLTDAGMNYASANGLYKMCHSQGVDFEYRVADGTDGDKDSLVRCLRAMLSRIGSQIRSN